MAVQERETRTPRAGKANGSGQVPGREARPAVERPLALLRKDQLGDQGGRTRRPTARAPKREAEILLTLPLPQVRKEVAAARMVDWLDHRGLEAHSSSRKRSRWRLT